MENKNVIVIARTTTKPGCEKQVKAELLNLVKHTLLEEGCITYQLHTSNNNPCEFMFYEVWATKDALDKHAKSEHIKRYRLIRDELLVSSEVTLWEEENLV